MAQAPPALPKIIERSASRVVITDEMMLKAVSMANEKDKVEAKVRLSQSQLGNSKGDTSNQVSKPGSSVKTSWSGTTAHPSPSGDSNGNILNKDSQESCPFDILCDFLTAVMNKNYKEALGISKTILLYEPDNEIALEFRDVLNQMVKGDDADSEDENGSGDADAGDTDKSESSCESESSTDSMDDSEQESGETNDDISLSSEESSLNSKGVGGAGDPLSKFFTTVDSSTEDDEADGNNSSTSEEDDSGSLSSSSSASSSSTDASVVADLLMTGAYGYDHSHDDTFDTFDMISSLDYELNESFGEFGADGALVEDLGELSDPAEDKQHGKNLDYF